MLAGSLLLAPNGLGSDQANTPTVASTPGIDTEDLYLFPSPQNPANVVLILDVHPFIPPGMGASTVFDPNVLYQFKIDNVGDGIEHLVIQFKFTGVGSNQQVQVSGPLQPSRTGVSNVFETPDSVTGTINTPFTLSTGVKVFAGVREDPFFFDLQQFFAILPDRGIPLNGGTVTNPNALAAMSWNATGTDFFKNQNVMSLIVELPKSMLGTGKIGVWGTTSR